MRERRDFDGKTKPTFETKRWGDIDFTCTRPVSDVLLPLAAEAHVEADQQQIKTDKSALAASSYSSSKLVPSILLAKV